MERSLTTREAMEEVFEMEVGGIPIPRNPNYARVAQRQRGDRPLCLICGQSVQPQEAIGVRVWLGTLLVRPDAPIPPPQDAGIHYIGAGCWKRHPELAPFRAL